MSNQAPPTYTAFRYMTRFRCIGGDCEANCCEGSWNITVDRDHYEKAKRAMSTHPATRQEFDAKVKRVKDPALKEKGYALLVLNNSGTCTFFGEDKLCTMQQRFGEPVLADTCSIYPRWLANSGGRLEQAGLPSCPEVTRQLILYPDAMDLVEVEPEALGRRKVQHSLEARPQKPYLRYHDELRNLMMDLLSDELYPLRSRLSFMAYFGNRTQPFLSQDTKELDEERLMAEVERIQDPAIRDELHRQFGSLEIDPVFATRMVYALVKARSKVKAFHKLLSSVLEGYSPATALPLDAPAQSAPVNAILQSYLAQKADWAPFASRIDRYLANYAKNYWAREWYAGSPDLLMHSIQLLTRIATLRFLILGHPLLYQTAKASEPERALALDHAAVAVVHTFSRAFEHDMEFGQHLRDQLAAANLISLAHAACLATF